MAGESKSPRSHQVKKLPRLIAKSREHFQGKHLIKTDCNSWRECGVQCQSDPPARFLACVLLSSWTCRLVTALFMGSFVIVPLGVPDSWWLSTSSACARCHVSEATAWQHVEVVRWAELFVLSAGSGPAIVPFSMLREASNYELLVQAWAWKHKHLERCSPTNDSFA